MTTHTTSGGTTVRVVTHETTGDRVVILDHRDAPDDMRNTEAGRVLDGGFQPAPFVAWALTPNTLRAIADLVEEENAAMWEWRDGYGWVERSREQTR